jgi:hypothetical protein
METDRLIAPPDDADLLSLIGDAVAETPSFVVEWGRQIYCWHSVDAELDGLQLSTDCD